VRKTETHIQAYRHYMESLIRSSRARAGWEIPWFVAQATYHSEQDSADEEFRAAQRALWESKIALQGPDTDALRKEFRNGVHFDAKGLQAHGRLWAEKVAEWLDKTLQ
jgi:eukaryotic-like serine/threonine-protein kinase